MKNKHELVWENCLKIIKDNINVQSYKTWFEPIKPVKLDGKSLTIQVPSQFFYEWLEDNYVPVLKKALTTVLGPSGRLEYSVIVDSGNTNNPPVAVHYPNGMGGKRQQSNGTTDEKSVKEMWAVAQRLESRVANLEKLLDAEAPGWRETQK